MKNKMLSIMLVVSVVCVAMAAPAWAATNLNTVQSGDWNTPATWDAGVPTDAFDGIEVCGDSDFGPGHVVTITAATNAIKGLKMWGGGKVEQTAGTLTVNTGDGMVIGDWTEGTYEISGGTLQCSGDVVVGTGNNGSTYQGDGTFKIIGSDATINVGGLLSVPDGDPGTPISTLSLVMDADGISPINAAQGKNGNDLMDLVVNLDAYTVYGTSAITLMDIGGAVIQGAFTVAAGAITMGGNPLTLGTQGALNPGEFFIDYEAGTVNDVVLSLNIEEPINEIPGVEVFDFSTWLVDPAPRIYPITTAVITDDNTSLHSYTWSATGPATVEFSPNSDNAAVDTDATFTAPGEYILTLTVIDGGHTVDDTCTVIVYEDGCEAAKVAVAPYSEEDARLKGDTDYNCDVNEVDLAAMALNWLADESTESMVVVDPVATPKFEIIALPDMENYYVSDGSEIIAPIIEAQTQWIANEQATENIVFVSQLGDLTHGGGAVEFDLADDAFDILDGQVPYSVSQGNHDGGLATQFGEARYTGYSWYGGSYGTNNHYQIFSAGDYEFLHINLVYGPDAETLAWAQTVVDANLGKPTIISTHAYLTNDGGVTVRSGTGNDIWNGLVKDNPQIFMTLNAHYHNDPASAHLLSENTAGYPVLQMLADFEDYDGPGSDDSGYLSRVIFDTVAESLELKTFSLSYMSVPWLIDRDVE